MKMRGGARIRTGPKKKASLVQRTAARAVAAERLEATDRLDLEARVPAEMVRSLEEDLEDQALDEDGPVVDADDWTDAEYGGDLDDEFEPGAFTSEDIVEGLGAEGLDDGRRLTPEPAINICRFRSGLAALPSPDEPPSEERSRLLQAVGDFLVQKYGESLCCQPVRELEAAIAHTPSSSSELRRWLGVNLSESQISRLVSGKFVRLPGAGVVSLGLFFQRDERKRGPSEKAERISAIMTAIFKKFPELTDERAAEVAFGKLRGLVDKRPAADWVSRWRKRLGIKNVYRRKP